MSEADFSLFVVVGVGLLACWLVFGLLGFYCVQQNDIILLILGLNG